MLFRRSCYSMHKKVIYGIKNNLKEDACISIILLLYKKNACKNSRYKLYFQCLELKYFCYLTSEKLECQLYMIMTDDLENAFDKNYANKPFRFGMKVE